MSSIISKYNTYFQQRCFKYLVYAYAVLLPIPNNLKSVALISLALSWLVSLIINPNSRQDAKELLQHKVVVSFLLLYLLSIISVAYSNNIKDAINFTLLLTSIPLLPFIFYKKLTSEQVGKANLLFAGSILLVSVIALVNTHTVYFNAIRLTVENLRYLDWAYFSYCLPISINFHAPYFSLYMCAGLLILLHRTYMAARGGDFWFVLAYILVQLYFLAFITLLSSRTALFATVGVVTIIICIRLALKRKVLVTAAVLAVSVAALFIALKSVPYLYAKVTSAAGLTERFNLWDSAVQIIEANPVLGIGTGDRKEELHRQYAQMNFEAGILKDLNVHNQFLETAVAMGLVGLLALLLAFSTILYDSVVRRQYVLLAFILIFAACSITESLLQRQAGVVLFSYFCAIFVFAEGKYKSN